MNKKELMELGINEELAIKIETSFSKILNDGYIPKTRFDEIDLEKNGLQETLKERDKQLETLKKSTDVEDMKKQIAELQSINTEKEKAHETEIKALKIETAVNTALVSAKSKNNKAVKALLDLEKAELAEDGTIKGLSDQIKKLVEAEDSKFLFDTTSTSKPAIKGAKPEETQVEKPDSAVNFSKMSYEEIAAYMAENPNTEIPTAYN